MSAWSASSETPRSSLFQSLQPMSMPSAGLSLALDYSTSLRVVVRSVGSVRVFSTVAFQLRHVALASAQTPKNALSGAFSRSRRAAHTEAVSRIRGRLAHKFKVASGASSKFVACPMRSQPARVDRVQMGRSESSVRLSASSVDASSALRH
jgi:hypothetical protein